MNIYGILKNGADEPVYREEAEMQTQRLDMWTQQGKERMERMETFKIIIFKLKNRECSRLNWYNKC